MEGREGYEPRRGRVGSRWLNERPSADDVAIWFAGNVKLHEGLKHEDFVAGITLIEQTDEVDTVVAYKANGEPTIAKVTEISFTPYPRVEARIAYFWAYLALHPEWTGAIEPAMDGSQGLPPGFFPLKVGETELIGRSMRVRILDRRGEDVHYYPSEAKTVPLVNRWGGLDADAMAKASTGAIGRALGVAGMLVLPGTGVATAEDMRQVQEGGSGTPSAAQALAAAVERPGPEELRERLHEALKRLLESDKREELNDWWTQRHLPENSKLSDEQVVIALRKVEKLAEDAQSTIGTSSSVDAS